MVRSNIFNECVYLETKKVNSRDEKIELQLYNIKILNCDNIFITLGRFSKKNRQMCLTKLQRENVSLYDDNSNTIVYYPIYLMDKDDNELVICRIGVYEVLETKHDNFLDEDGDLIIEDLTPLLFNFVTETFLKENNYICQDAVLSHDDILSKVVENEKMIEVITIDDNNNNIDNVDTIEDSVSNIERTYVPSDSLIDIYPKQTIEQYNDEVNKSYLSKPLESDEHAQQWLRAYLMNINYRIIEKGGCGDCLFYSLASAINDYSITNKSNGVPVFSVQDVSSLREILSENITEEQYDNYISLYKELNSSKNHLTREIKRYLEEHRRISEKFKNATTKLQQKELVIENNEIKKLIRSLEKELISTKEMLSEFKYMSSLKTIRDFKSFVLTSQFWGDEMSLGILQKYFNFKAVVLSQENFVKAIQNVPLPLTESIVNNMKNIIQCGSSSLGGLENPYFYIILNFTGSHYQLVTYRNKEAFTFNELPFGLKIRIMKECMRQDLEAGYGKIEQFVKFRDDNIEYMF
jgi:hypothetical protein